MLITLKTIPEIKARIPSREPSPEVKRLFSPIDLSQECAFSDKTLAAWAVRSKISIDNALGKVLEHRDLERAVWAAFSAMFCELVPDGERFTRVMKLIGPLEKDFEAAKRENRICAMTKNVAKRVEAMVEAYLKSPRLQEILFTGEITERIIHDLEFLVEDPVNNVESYSFGKRKEQVQGIDKSNTKITQTREFILGSLNQLVERDRLEVSQWLYNTYLKFREDADEDSYLCDFELMRELETLFGADFVKGSAT